MSGRIAKSQIPVKSQTSLTPGTKAALINAKNRIRAGENLVEFQNNRGNSPLEGPPLPAPTQGCVYFEYQVGEARPDDPMGIRGSKRLVIEAYTASRKILEVYYTEEHYTKFSFVRVV